MSPAIVIDNANKQAVAELEKRHDLPLTAADKVGKSDFMEIMNGEFIQGRIKLKAEAKTQHIPVVIVTTRGESSAVELCRSLGCAEFITKPLDRVQLQVTVRKLLDGAKK